MLHLVLHNFHKQQKFRLRFSIKGLYFQMCEIMQILTPSSIRRGEEIGTIGFKCLGIWEEKGLKIENCRLEFGIKGFSNEMREIVEKYTGFFTSARWWSEDRWKEWVSNKREGRKNRCLGCFCGKKNIWFWSFSPCWCALRMLLTWIPGWAILVEKRQATQSAWNSYKFPH